MMRFQISENDEISPTVDTRSLLMARLCGMAAILVGISGLLGWIFGIAEFNSIIPGYKPIAISASIAFLLLGSVQLLVTVIPFRHGLDMLLLGIALVVTVFGSLEVFYLLTGVDLTLEDAILRQYPRLYGNPDVHISPVAGMLSFLLGLAQSLYLYHRVSGRKLPGVANFVGAIGSLVIVISTVFFLSYIYRTPLLYGTVYLPIAWLATLAACALGIGVVISAGNGAFPLCWFAGTSTRAVLMRAFLPLTALVMLLFSLVQFFFLRLTRINPAITVSVLAILFEIIIGVIILHVARMVGMQLDRTRAEREHTAALEASNKELEAFSYSVSHDLRAPLRGIDGFSKILLEKYAGGLDERGRDYLERVRAAAQRMGRLIDDMLKLSRIGRAELRREPVNLSSLAAEIISDLRQREPERTVEVEIAPGLVVSGDAALLRIMLENLLGNAWKFTGKREVARISMETQLRDGAQVYAVRDNGAGFDMSYADKLFAPFQRLHTEEEFAGTGIGLAIVQRIIARHGGRVWVESAPEQGTTIYFTL